MKRIPTYARKVFDVTGAGDTVIAVLSLMSVVGRPLEECMRVANAAAGVVVGQIGAASVTPDELRTELDHLAKEGFLE
jgi:D-beta-D-heptose 7-phosphate kinase/D-beta-D-heptose 1-phosphate adenosyltransferase